MSRARSDATAGILPALANKKIIVCVGAGGVGKTTLAAAIAVRATRLGRRVACLTIDPARRLADSLGVAAPKPATGTTNGSGLTDVTHLLGTRVETGGQLMFGMLDTENAFADVIRQRASSPRVVERVLQNRLYRYISGSLSGLQEYMALEQLCAIGEDPAVELIVLDTPPTANAIDFFTAPRRMIEALDGKLVRMMRRTYRGAGRVGFDLLGRWAGIVLKTIGRIAGVELLREMIEFIDALSDLFGGFAIRARQAEGVLRDSGATFFLITTPDRATVRETREFRGKLYQLGLSADGVVFNRAHWPKTSPIPSEINPDIATELRQINAEWDHAAAREAALIRRVQNAWDGLESVTIVPLLPDDATRIDALDQIGRHF